MQVRDICYLSFKGLRALEKPCLTSFLGDCLISSGDDGAVRFWKMSLAGEWLEYAETDMSY